MSSPVPPPAGPPQVPPPGYPQPQGYPPPPGYPPGQAYPPRPYPPRTGMEIGPSFRFAWDTFSHRPGPLIIGGAAFLLISLLYAAAFLPAYFQFVVSLASGPPRVDAWALALLGGAALLVVVALPLLMSGFVRMCLDLVDGRPVSLFAALRPHRPGVSLATTLLAGLAILVGYLLFVVPGILAAWAFGFSVWIVHDDRRPTPAGPVQAMKESLALMRAHLGPALVALLLGGLVASAGSYLAVVGVAISLPLGYLFLAHQYRGLTVAGTSSQR